MELSSSSEKENDLSRSVTHDNFFFDFLIKLNKLLKDIELN